MHITDPRAFRNCIASLFNLDRYDLQSGGVIEPGEAGNDDWYQLNENTARWVLHLDDARLAALWALIEARQRRSPVDAFLADVAAEIERARTKFPGDNLTTIALMEEVGEVAKAALDESPDALRKEAVQVACMAARLVLDGDGSTTAYRENRGLAPIVPR